MALMEAPMFFLRVWGIWPITTLDSNMKKKMYRAYTIFVIGNYTFFNILQGIECIRLVIHKQPFERISMGMSVVATLVLMLWKSFIYVRNKIPEMCLKVFEIESTLNKIHDEKIQTTYKNIKKTTAYVNLWIIGSSLFTIIAFAGASFAELINIGPDFWDLQNVTFMHELYLPFNRREHYRLIIFANIFLSVESCILSGAIQTTFLGLTVYASLQLRILQINLEQFDIGSRQEKETVKGFLQKHQDAISFIVNLDQAIKNVLLMGFLLNSIKLASVLFQLFRLKDITALAFPIFYSLVLITEVFYIGWLCNEIKEQSLGVANAAFNTRWYVASKDVKVMLQIMIMRAQKPLTMSIGPFGTMSTDTIVTTMKAAYSYTTLMSNQK